MRPRAGNGRQGPAPHAHGPSSLSMSSAASRSSAPAVLAVSVTRISEFGNSTSGTGAAEGTAATRAARPPDARQLHLRIAARADGPRGRERPAARSVPQPRPRTTVPAMPTLNLTLDEVAGTQAMTAAIEADDGATLAAVEVQVYQRTDEDRRRRQRGVAGREVPEGLAGVAQATSRDWRLDSATSSRFGAVLRPRGGRALRIRATARLQRPRLRRRHAPRRLHPRRRRRAGPDPPPARPGEDETAAVELIRSRVGWPLRLAPTLEREPPPDPAALAELRRFDPRRSFIGKPGSLAE